MKNLLALTGLIFSVFASSMAFTPDDNPTPEEGIQFQTGSWSDVLKLAEKENKIIFLDIYASWCGPCKALKARTFPNAEVGAFFNSNFINFAIDAEKGEGISLANLYRISGYPTLLFLDGKGNLIAKTMGYHSPEQLLEAGKEILKTK